MERGDADRQRGEANGTSQLTHFEENLKAADINLSEEDMLFLE